MRKHAVTVTDRTLLPESALGFAHSVWYDVREQKNSTEDRYGEHEEEQRERKKQKISGGAALHSGIYTGVHTA